MCFDILLVLGLERTFDRLRRIWLNVHKITNNCHSDIGFIIRKSVIKIYITFFFRSWLANDRDNGRHSCGSSFSQCATGVKESHRQDVQGKLLMLRSGKWWEDYLFNNEKLFAVLFASAICCVSSGALFPSLTMCYQVFPPNKI